MDIMTKERLIKLAEEEIPIHKYFGLKVEIVEKDFIKVKASLFFIQFKNQLFLSYEEKQIYRSTDSLDASAV